eukprot:CAMPEP_0198229968 /NCGR_PEP_ID=MMETSP1445-20131203/114401_1 /TAXON_ID=36898 /ORGANISM="Pyramimonas sp., Strain CCMP2087" /LENGTH=249 /DNA_ID=CAMNT_0043910453 /DNA_START=377 /DNA_END=1126 /DNA_ORIENTATION=+
MTCPSATIRAPYANSFNAPPLPYNWKAPVPLPTREPTRAAGSSPAQRHTSPIVRAGEGPDAHKQRGLAKGYYREKYTNHGCPYPRDEGGVGRKDWDHKLRDISKNWDTNCGQIPKLPPVDKSILAGNKANARGRVRCDLRNDGQSASPVPKGLEKICPHDTSNWLDYAPKPMVKMSEQFTAHTNHVTQHGHRGNPEPGQSATQFGGRQHLYLPTAPAATIERLCKGELRHEYINWAGCDRPPAGQPSKC